MCEKYAKLPCFSICTSEIHMNYVTLRKTENIDLGDPNCSVAQITAVTYQSERKNY